MASALSFPGPLAPAKKPAVEDFDQAYQTWSKSPRNPADNDAILKASGPVIDTALRSFAGADAAPHLRTEAKRIVLDALPGYDPQRASLKTYLTTHLQGLRRAKRQRMEVLAVPERVGMDRDYLYRSARELEDAVLGRPPTDQELADHSGLPLERIRKVRMYQPGLAEGALKPADDGEPAAPAVAHDAGPMLEKLVYMSLGPIDQLIMEHTLGLHGQEKLSNRDLAAKLRLSAGAISQRKTKIQTMMDSSALSEVVSQ